MNLLTLVAEQQPYGKLKALLPEGVEERDFKIKKNTTISFLGSLQLYEGLTHCHCPQ